MQRYLVENQDYRSLVWFLLFATCTAITFCMAPPIASGQEDTPDRGGNSAEMGDQRLAIAEIDDAIAAFMDKSAATAATVAIGWKGKIIYSRGYGTCDRRGRMPTTPRTTMRLASCTKPFTAAAISELVARDIICSETLVFDYLAIRPKDDLLNDERVRQVTVGHLLDHRGGWDRDATFDPLYRIEMIRQSMRIARLQKHHIARYMWQHPLQADPGAEEHYSNFGYLLLGLVIEKATGKSYVESVRELLGDSLDVEGIMISSQVQRNRKSYEVHYPDENQLNLHLRDSASGLATNAETLCRFMDAYWLDGQKRDEERNRFYYQFGTHPWTTTAIMEQRLDKINYAILLNSRDNEEYETDNDAFREHFNGVLDDVKSRLAR